jgi:hypothetical protein
MTRGKQMTDEDLDGLEKVARDLGGVANLLEHRMSTEDNLVRENSRQAAVTCREAARMIISLLSGLPASSAVPVGEGEGNSPASIESGSSPSGATETPCQSEGGALGEAEEAHAALTALGVPTHIGPDQGNSGPIERLSVAQRIAHLPGGAS